MATSSKTLRRRQADIAAFVESLSDLLAVLQPDEGSFGGYPTWHPQPGQEHEAARRAGLVDRVAGRATVALSRPSIIAFIDWKPRGTWATQRVNPAATWRTILDDDPMFPPDAILGTCNQAIGGLDALAVEAEEHEASFAGKVERVARLWPQRAGIEGRMKWFGGALVALAIGLLVAYLSFRLGWVGG